LRLEVQDLACVRGERRVFEGLSFEAQDGEALVVVGRNGAGKSSLLGLLMGQIAPASGSIRIIGAGDRTLPECLHFVGHRDALKGALTAEENLAFFQSLLGSAWRSPGDALEAVGLAHAARLPVAYLSAGQRRRVALARLLVAHRPLWLLDEPSSALDAASQQRLHDLMEAHRDRGGMIIATTHAPLSLRDSREIRIERGPQPVRERAE
jgi:heme exporter protein A